MCQSGALTTYGNHITQLMTVMTQLQLPQESICRSILVYRGNDECPRVRKLGLVTPPYHTEPSKAIGAQWQKWDRDQKITYRTSFESSFDADHNGTIPSFISHSHTKIQRAFPWTMIHMRLLPKTSQPVFRGWKVKEREGRGKKEEEWEKGRSLVQPLLFPPYLPPFTISCSCPGKGETIFTLTNIKQTSG